MASNEHTQPDTRSSRKRVYVSAGDEDEETHFLKQMRCNDTVEQDSVLEPVSVFQQCNIGDSQMQESPVVGSKRSAPLDVSPESNSGNRGSFSAMKRVRTAGPPSRLAFDRLQLGESTELTEGERLQEMNHLLHVLHLERSHRRFIAELCHQQQAQQEHQQQEQQEDTMDSTAAMDIGSCEDDHVLPKDHFHLP